MKKFFYILFILLLFVEGGLKAQERTQIQVLSAVVKDKKIENAEVLLQRNGEQTVVGRTNADGIVTLSPSFGDTNDAMVIIKKEGYSTLVAKCLCQGLTYAISPIMQNLDGMRIVLSWGATPADLDSHIWYSNQHVYYSSKVGRNSNLDVDDTDSYGPETITVEEKEHGTEYYYAVHDYTNKSNPISRQLSNSGAKVFVYIGQSLVKTYYVPADKAGNLWTVFKVTKDGEIVDINSFAQVTESSDKLRYSTIDAAGNITRIDKEEAKRLNKLGTEYYNNKRYIKAIEYYKAAIDNDPDFGLAWGNLGLSYKKNGQKAEALWANRKAISLAHGNTAHIVRAGAHYNIGRIYEEEGEYAKAKIEYEASKSENDKETYDKAIKRMDDLLNEE